MGQFKPMVKMKTTEPSIELKLKKGGKVEKKMQMGGDPGMAPPAAMPARGGMMGARAPMKPSMASRRRAMRAMPSGAGPAAPVGMAGRMMKEGGESTALQEHAAKPASKAHKGLKTGGVVMGQAGYKAGGIINTEGQGGKYRNTKMDTAKPDHSPAKTGGVKMGKPGGYATGGVAKSNAGGYKKGGVAKMMGGGMAYMEGGAAKKAFAAGGVVDSGAPVAMPQGRKKPSAPVSITALSGTFKKGGKVTAAEGRLQKNFKKENAPAMKAAKADSNEVYSKYGKKMKEGGVPASVRDQRQTEENQRAYQNWERLQTQENQATRNAITGLPRRIARGIKGLFSSEAPKGSVTETKESVTVAPAKKRGGAVTC